MPASAIVAGLLIFVAVANPGIPASRLHPWGKPTCLKQDEVTLHNLAYDCCYSQRLRVARWVAYLYTPGGPRQSRRYRGGFTADPRLGPEGPAPADYVGVGRLGLDRGHQAPDASIRRFGPKAQKETYYLSNITPQYQRVNRNIWQELESAIREWAGKSDTVWVVTGPVFNAGRDTQWLGRRRIAVPHAYFCAVRRTGTTGLLALLVPNARNGYSWADAPGFLVSVDSVEKLTGLDLFPRLKPAEAQRLESAPARQLWPRPDKRRGP